MTFTGNIALAALLTGGALMAQDGLTAKQHFAAAANQALEQASLEIRAHYFWRSPAFFWSPWNWKNMLIAEGIRALTGSHAPNESHKEKGHRFHGWLDPAFDYQERGAGVMKYSVTSWKETQIEAPEP